MIRSQNIDALDSKEPFDVCIIGSGPAGTIVGTDLVKQGIRTVILESGSSLIRWLYDSRLKDLAAYEFTGDTDYPLSKTKARLLGGNSNFWTGRCERFHPSDFDRHPYSPIENPWPLSYNDLAPYYEIAEKTLRVRGGHRSEFVPPRDSDFALPPKPDISYLKSLFSKAGVVVDDSPTATPTKTFRFFNVQKEVLPNFLASPCSNLVTGTTVIRLNPDTSRRINNAEVRTLNGEKKNVSAKIFVLACGGIENPRLLLLSKSEQFPNGIGNSFDMVGKGFNEHPNLSFYASVNHEIGTIIPTNKIGRTHQFYSDFRSEGLGSILPVFRQSWILPHHMMPFRFSNIPRNMFSILRRLIKPTLFIGASTEMKISYSNCVELSRNQKDIFGNPIAHLIFNYSEDDLKLLERGRELILKIYKKLNASNIQESQVTFSRHHQGTCRMGNNYKTSVVNRHLRVHDCENLYLCGSDVFVTGGGMQPCLTIAAFAHRLSEHLIARFKEGST